MAFAPGVASGDNIGKPGEKNNAMQMEQGEAMKIPDPLLMQDGRRVQSSAEWLETGRASTLDIFRANIYGRAPLGRPDDLKFEIESEDRNAFNGIATSKIVRISYSGKGGKGAFRLVLYVPNDADRPPPGFLLINNRKDVNLMPEGKFCQFFPPETIVRRGYFAAAFFNGEIDPDENDGFKNGVHGIFDRQDAGRPPDAWGTVAAWAWGASRALDYIETDRDIDARRVAVVGHSRGGKTALWAAAEDTRFAMAVSNDSGCTGAKIARRKIGETVKAINTNFPHWFCANYKRFNDREDELPVDQHQLLALIAPRPLYVASATEDMHADPEGEFMSCILASPVYALFSLKGIAGAKMPPPNTAMHDGAIGYHIRKGGHDLTELDWNFFMDFADKRLH